MDSELEQRWKSAMPPFDGECLHLDDCLLLPQLRSLMISVVNVLRRSNATLPLYRFDDWHEHDGFVTQRTVTDWGALDAILANDDSLYTARHGDTYVNWAFYPSDYSFLFRFDISDSNDDPNCPDIWGDCDLCASPSLIGNVKCTTSETLASRLVITNAKQYFDNNYAG